MFPYFGRKATLAPSYPGPTYPLVIEPFAGSMAYSLHHQPDLAIGIERDERLFDLWHRMLRLTEVPEPPVVGSTTDDLLVKLCSYSEHASTSGPMTVTSRMVRDWRSVHERAMRQARWASTAVNYTKGSYLDAPDLEATWFIDPPYQQANRRGYRYGASGINFNQLAEWCKSRRGQVIVCEQEGADWLPFVPLAEIVSHRGVRKSEVVWVS